MSHTPGPWKAEKATARGVWNVVRADDPDELWLGQIWTSDADARLIAAAPELLDVLRGVLANAGSHIDTEWLERASFALAKAEGREP